MKRYDRGDLVAGLFLIAIAVCVVMGFATAAEARTLRVMVERVKDGDTFVLSGYRTLGTATEVRVLGFDTPEKSYPHAKCDAEIVHAKKATEFANSLVSAGGGIVWLSRAAKGPKKDLYGRQLFNVYLQVNGKRVSWRDEIITAGYAMPYAKNEKGLLIKPDWCAILSPKQPADLLEQVQR